MAGKIKELNEGTFDAELGSTDHLIIVEFYTNTCPNCRAIAPVYAQLSEELHKSATFVIINAETNPALASRYGVLGVPTFKFFCEGQPIGELVGSINTTLLRNTIKDLIRHRKECVAKSTPLTYEIDGYG
ncbi:MAG: thioredoxin [Thermoplasmata archaeon]|nr:MAG: thioredoxin [Thermoplasmata archaeon]